MPLSPPAPLPSPAAVEATRPDVVVLDTNVVLDWLVFAEPRIAPLAAALASGQLRWIATAGMLEELAHVLARPALARWRPRLGPAWETAQAACALVQAPPLAPARVLWCSDPDDQPFIDLALTWPAAWLFSRDKALLKLARRAAQQGVRVATPDAWPAAAPR